LPELQLTQIKVFARNADYPARNRIKPSRVERNQQNEKDVNEDRDNQGLGTGRPQLQLGILIEKHWRNYRLDLVQFPMSEFGFQNPCLDRFAIAWLI
jgi:hypothetical protein